MTKGMEAPMSEASDGAALPPVAPGTVVVVESGEGPLEQYLLDGRHRLVADEPAPLGGDAGPNPYELLLMSLGACTAMTLRLYARRKAWPLTRVAVRLRHSRIHAADCAECDTKTGFIDRMEREIDLAGPLDAAQRARLLEIADMCPVHRTLTSEINIRTRLAAS
jgi:putative redox protein